MKSFLMGVRYGANWEYPPEPVARAVEYNAAEWESAFADVKAWMSANTYSVFSREEEEDGVYESEMDSEKAIYDLEGAFEEADADTIRAFLAHPDGFELEGFNQTLIVRLA